MRLCALFGLNSPGESAGDQFDTEQPLLWIHGEDICGDLPSLPVCILLLAEWCPHCSGCGFFLSPNKFRRMTTNDKQWTIQLLKPWIKNLNLGGTWITQYKVTFTPNSNVYFSPGTFLESLLSKVSISLELCWTLPRSPLPNSPTSCQSPSSRSGDPWSKFTVGIFTWLLTSWFRRGSPVWRLLDELLWISLELVCTINSTFSSSVRPLTFIQERTGKKYWIIWCISSLQM